MTDMYCTAFLPEILLAFWAETTSPAELELLYIDDLIEEMLDALEGKEHRCEYPKDELHSGLKARLPPHYRMLPPQNYSWACTTCQTGLGSDIPELLPRSPGHI